MVYKGPLVCTPPPPPRKREASRGPAVLGFSESCYLVAAQQAPSNTRRMRPSLEVGRMPIRLLRGGEASRAILEGPQLLQLQAF